MREGQWNCLWTAPTFKFHYLVGGFNPFEKYARQNGNLLQIGVKIKNNWNHHLDYGLTIFWDSFSGTCWNQEFWRTRDPSYMTCCYNCYSNDFVMPSLSHQNRNDFSKAPGAQETSGLCRNHWLQKLQRNQNPLLVMNALLQQSNVVCWKSPFVTRQQEWWISIAI